MPLFPSFDEAWQWFADGGTLVPVEEQRAHLGGGRAQLLAFQAPMAEPPVQSLADDVLDALDGIDGLLPLPDDLLHCTVRTAGFQVIRKQRPDDLLREDIGLIVGSAYAALEPFAPVTLEAGPVNVFPDALVLEVHDGGALAAIRRAITPIVASDAFGLDESQYLPHVSIAFFAHDGCADALRSRLPALRELTPARVTVSRIDFVRWWLLGDEAALEAPERDVVRSYPLRRQ